MRRLLNSTRLPIALSVIALAVALGRGGPSMRVSQAADPHVTEGQKQVLLNLQDAFTNIAEAVEPSVVGIHVEPAVAKRSAITTGPGSGDNSDAAPPQDFNPFGDLPFDFGPFTRRGAPRATPSPRRGYAAGSGVFIQRSGDEYYILTNYHVVEGGGDIKVQLGGRDDEVRGTLVGSDQRTDLAVVKVRLIGAQGDRRVAQFDDSDNVKVGQWAIAIGNPLDVGETLTVGVVSAKGRDLTGQIPQSLADYSNLIQTDASINPGNSGGALVDINGKVIGINTAIASPTQGSIGIGFAIPSNVARAIADQLIRHGEVVRGWLGVETSMPNWKIRPAMARVFGTDHGAFLENVEPDTPASKSGLQAEDVIVQWGNTPIRSYTDLTHAVADTPPGQNVPIRLIRNGKALNLTVHTERRPPEDVLQKQLATGGPTPNGPDRGDTSVATATANGITVRALSGSDRAKSGVGVLVTNVEDGSSAADAGLAPGVVIDRVDEAVIHTPADFKAAMARLKDGLGFVLRLSVPGRDGAFTQRTMAVEPAP